MKTIALTAVACLVVGCSSPDQTPVQFVEPEFVWQNLDTLLWAEMLAAEDARADTEEGLAPIVVGLASPSRETRQVAVRALGRLERPALVPLIAPLLLDTAAAVRAEAANAIGQAVFRGQAGVAVGPLLTRLDQESDAFVRGVIAQTLGNLPYESSDTVRVVKRGLLRRLERAAQEGRVDVRVYTDDAWGPREEKVVRDVGTEPGSGVPAEEAESEKE